VFGSVRRTFAQTEAAEHDREPEPRDASGISATPSEELHTKSALEQKLYSIVTKPDSANFTVTVCYRIEQAESGSTTEWNDSGAMHKSIFIMEGSNRAKY